MYWFNLEYIEWDSEYIEWTLIILNENVHWLIALVSLSVYVGVCDREMEKTQKEQQEKNQELEMKKIKEEELKKKGKKPGKKDPKEASKKKTTQDGKQSVCAVRSTHMGACCWINTAALITQPLLHFHPVHRCNKEILR